LGGSTPAVSPYSETCTTFGVADCLEPKCSASTNLVLLRPGDSCLVSPVVAASVDIRSIRGSARGPSLYGCCFSTATVSTDGLELLEQAGAS